MEALLLYVLKSSICFCLLYLGFFFLLRKMTWFHFNRSVILWGCFFCVSLPLVQLQLRSEIPIQIPIEFIHSIAAPSHATAVLEGGEESSLSVWQVPSSMTIVGVCYAIGCLVVLLITLLSGLRVWAIIRRSECCNYKGCKLYVSSEQEEPFSWSRSIVIPKVMYDSRKDFDEVFFHELSHLRRRHSIDILFMQFILIFHWFNPFIWLLRRELLDIHEYQADHDVINQGINATQYQLLLVKKAVGGRLYILANGFKHSKLKKRITMMLKKRTNRMSQLRVLLFLPLAIGALYSFATIPPASAEQDQQWAYPLPESTLKGLYGGHKHSGIDLKAEMGTPIKAAFNGIVTSAVSDPMYGKRVVIRHNDGLETSYAHNSENLVKEGEAVKAGQIIALVGNSGRSSGSHCHFEVKKAGTLIDPEMIFDTEKQTLRIK